MSWQILRMVARGAIIVPVVMLVTGCGVSSTAALTSATATPTVPPSPTATTPPPNCGSNFTGGPPAAQNVNSLPGYTPTVPLPPESSTVPDDASGGVRGYDVCSPGTAESVSAYMTGQLPAAGWTKIAATPACVYTSECWQNGSAVISWDAGSDPLDWHIAWRVSA